MNVPGGAATPLDRLLNESTLCRLMFYAACAAAVGLYWSGLGGPFVLDDAYNFGPLEKWLQGTASAREIIWGNASGELGRPVSMASFLLTVATGGMHPFPFKFGNLLIHLACATAVWQLFRRLLAHDVRLAAYAERIALAVAVIWLLHPINVSTVLYAVQRMAQLSTFFVLLALLAYVQGRRLLASGDTARASRFLFVAFPAAFLIGLLSKENAAVAPALCLLIEIAYFRGLFTRERRVQWFFGLFLLAPMLLATGLLVVAPEKLLGLYDTRDFTMLERLLSQPRALMTYVGLLLWPRGGLMGVFVDDFTVSEGLLSPPGTLASIVALLVITGVVYSYRRKAPTVFLGWSIFLVAHGVESTFLPLELYFEHRNYLPATGLLLASACLLFLLGQRVRLHSQALFVIGRTILVPGILAGLMWVSWTQVQTWRSEGALAEQALRHRPDSMRAKIVKAGVALKERRFVDAQELAQSLAMGPDQRNRMQGFVHSITIDCFAGAAPNLDNLDRAVDSAIAPIRLSDASSFRPLARALEEGRCGGALTPGRLADAIVRIIDGAATQPNTSRPKWMLRTTAATLYARAGEWDAARYQAEMAWQPNADPAVGALLVRIYVHLGDRARAEAVLGEVASRVETYEVAGSLEIARLRQAVGAML